MARGRGPAMASTMVANPYGKPRDIQPTYTTCELCTRTIMTKDWSAHKNSKGHRKNEDDQKPKENQPPAWGNSSGNGIFGTDSVWGNATGGQDDTWGDAGLG